MSAAQVLPIALGLLLAGGQSETGPKKDRQGWTLLYCSSDPSIWNSDVDEGKTHYAISLAKAPEDVKYLRLRRISTKEFVIIDMKNRVLNTDDAEDVKGDVRWCGSNSYNNNAYHLGVRIKAWVSWENGSIIITHPIGRGYGFGHRAALGDVQGYTWAGIPIGKTVFEISVSTKEKLTSGEKKNLLK